VAQALHQSTSGHQPVPETARLQAHLLGAFRLYDAATGQNYTPTGRKSRAVLAHLLLVPGQQASRDRLAGLLWSDRGEEQAKTSLRQALADVRRTMPQHQPDWLDARRDNILILPGSITTDIEQTEAAAMSGDLPKVLEGIKNWSDELLADLSSLDTAFDDWLYGERAHRTAALVDLIGTAVKDGLEQGEISVSRDIVRRLLALDPANEMLGRLALKSAYLAQDIAALHRHYRQLTDYMAREFQAKPSPETRDLFHELSALRAVPDLPQGDASIVAASAKTDLNPPVIILQPLAGLTGEDSIGIALGLSDDIRVALARYPELRIISAKGLDPQRITAIANDSVAGYRATGSVRTGGGKTRISFQLNALADGQHVWAKQFDVAAAELPNTADEVVAKIIGAVAPAVEQHLDQHYATPDETTASAYALYLAGRQFRWNAKTLAEVEQAAHYLEQAIAQSPKLAVAYPPLVTLYNTDLRYRSAGNKSSSLRVRALELAKTAVVLDRTNPDAHMVLGWCQLRHQQWHQAGQSFQKALALNPYYADLINAVGFGMSCLGELDLAETLLQRAFELNPFPRDEYFSDLAVLNFLRGNCQLADEDFDLARDESPPYQAVRVANLVRLDRKPAAILLGQKLRGQIQSIWQGSMPHSDANYIAWVLQQMPFRMPEHQALVTDGLRAAGFDI
jgi:DNA-binding SARP family transcriptional activator/Flp pilus assembly protein TadD